MCYVSACISSVYIILLLDAHETHLNIHISACIGSCDMYGINSTLISMNYN